MEINVYIIIIFVFHYSTRAVMIKKKCPQDEIYISCTLYEEYTCWETKEELHRVMVQPRLLPHCRGRCQCRKAYVRAYPLGPCIPAATCRSNSLQNLLNNMPFQFVDF